MNGCARPGDGEERMAVMNKTKRRRCTVAVIGGSAGGLDVTQEILSGLAPDTPAAIVVCLHLHPRSQGELAEILSRRSVLPVVEVEPYQPLQSGRVHLAPPNYHVLVEQDGSLSLDASAKIHFSRPSIDALFETAADAFGRVLAGVILTGASRDGARGLQRIHERGGVTIVQDPKTSFAGFMPSAACALTAPDYILQSAEIAGKLMELFDLPAVLDYTEIAPRIRNA